jgi:hypothetical protein
MTPKHDFAKRPPELFWLDPSVLQAIIQEDDPIGDPTETKSSTRHEMILLTQVHADHQGTMEDQSDMLKRQQHQEGTIQYPMTPTAQAVGDFRTTPLIHGGYAATWFGLSGAGWYMTRMLITRGRG